MMYFLHFVAGVLRRTCNLFVSVCDNNNSIYMHVVFVLSGHVRSNRVLGQRTFKCNAVQSRLCNEVKYRLDTETDLRTGKKASNHLEIIARIRLNRKSHKNHTLLLILV